MIYGSLIDSLHFRVIEAVLGWFEKFQKERESIQWLINNQSFYITNNWNERWFAWEFLGFS